MLNISLKWHPSALKLTGLDLQQFNIPKLSQPECFSTLAISIAWEGDDVLCKHSPTLEGDLSTSFSCEIIYRALRAPQFHICASHLPRLSTICIITLSKQPDKNSSWDTFWQHLRDRPRIIENNFAPNTAQSFSADHTRSSQLHANPPACFPSWK